MDRRNERTRAAVLEATVELLACSGSRVGMTEIAQAAGVSRKAVYENFGSRDQVLRQVTRGLLSADPALTDIVCPDGTAALQLLAEYLVQHVMEYRNFYSAVLPGPCGYAVKTALADHLTGVLYRLRSRRADPVETGPGDRFAIHGLLGMLTDTLTGRAVGDLNAVVTGLQRELAA